MSENQHNFVKVLVLYSIFECFLIKLFNFNKTQNVKFPFVTVNFNGSIETFRCYEGKYCCKTHTQNRNTHTMRTTLREKLCTKCTTACVMKDCETQTYSHFIFSCAPLHTISSIDTSYISYIYRQHRYKLCSVRERKIPRRVYQNENYYTFHSTTHSSFFCCCCCYFLLFA